MSYDKALLIYKFLCLAARNGCYAGGFLDQNQMLVGLTFSQFFLGNTFIIHDENLDILVLRKLNLDGSLSQGPIA
jgi:hypothetical protein